MVRCCKPIIVQARPASLEPISCISQPPNPAYTDSRARSAPAHWPS